MSINETQHDNNPPTGSALPRMLIGLLQGLALYCIYQSWSAKTWAVQEPMLLSPLLLVSLLVPPALISGLAHMPWRKLLLWCLLLTALLVGIGFYDAWRNDLHGLLAGEALNAWQREQASSWFSTIAFPLTLVPSLVVAQAMVLAGSADGRYIARYASYFAMAWKLMLQISFAALFTGALWLVLEGGALLFGLVKLQFLHTLLRTSWFAIPVTTLAFACALHLTDVRPAIIAGMRKLLLTMLSWLLPLAVVLVGGFLAALVIVGLQPLWATRRAALVLLGAAALLIFLINVVYQDGLSTDTESGARRHRLVRLWLRLACVLPAPLVTLAAYALTLRVTQYGWTVERISAALSIVIVAIYAIGYAVAALRLRQALTWVAPTNILASLATLALLLAELSPLADPARLAVADQLARLRDGRTDASKLDMRFLRFDSARHGVVALHALAQSSEPNASQARNALTLGRWDAEKSARRRADLTINIRPHGTLKQLPAGFVQTDWAQKLNSAPFSTPACMHTAGEYCDAYPATPIGQTDEQLLIIDENAPRAFLFRRDPKTAWDLVGTTDLIPACRKLLQKTAEQGKLAWLPARQPDLVIAGVRLPLIPFSPFSVDAARCDGKDPVEKTAPTAGR